MANRFTDAVFHAQRIPLTEKAILWALAHRADNQTGECYPSIARIAQDAGASERTVTRTMKLLLRMGLVKITGKQRYRGGHAHNIYQVSLTGLQKLAVGRADPDTEVNSAGDRGQVDGGVGQVDSQSGSGRPTNSSNNSSLNSKENSSINSSNDSIDGAPSEMGQRQGQNQKQPPCAQPPVEPDDSFEDEELRGLTEAQWYAREIIWLMREGKEHETDRFRRILHKIEEKAELLVAKKPADYNYYDVDLVISNAVHGYLDTPQFSWSTVIREATNPMAMFVAKFEKLNELHTAFMARMRNGWTPPSRKYQGIPFDHSADNKDWPFA
jgi:hypothetical protein